MDSTHQLRQIKRWPDLRSVFSQDSRAQQQSDYDGSANNTRPSIESVIVENKEIYVSYRTPNGPGVAKDRVHEPTKEREEREETTQAYKEEQTPPSYAGVSITLLSTSKGKSVYFGPMKIFDGYPTYRCISIYLNSPSSSLLNMGTQQELQRSFSQICPITAADGVVESYLYRCRLQELLSGLRSLNDLPRVHNAISNDYPQVVELLKAIIRSPEEKETMLRLGDDDSERFMDAVQEILDEQTQSEQFNADVRMLLVPIVMTISRLPKSMFISGVGVVQDKNMLGGTFGDIYRSTYKGEPVALKRLRIFRTSERTKIYRVRASLPYTSKNFNWASRNFARKLRFGNNSPSNMYFPSWVSTRKTFRDNLMVSPWMSNGTAPQFLKQNPSANIDKLVGFYLLSVLFLEVTLSACQLFEIAQGIEYLHSQSVVHGDIKGGNILIDEQWHPKLADFGLTVFADATRQFTTDQGGTLRWMAPELLRPLGNFKRTFSSDIYAYGCVCVELHSGRVPFPDIKHEVRIIEMVLSGDLPPRPAAMTEDLWRLVYVCCENGADMRPGASEIVEMLRTFLRESATEPGLMKGYIFSKLKSSSSSLIREKFTFNLAGSSDNSSSPGVKPLPFRSGSMLRQTIDEDTPHEDLSSTAELFKEEDEYRLRLLQIRVHADPQRSYHNLVRVERGFSVEIYRALAQSVKNEVTIKCIAVEKQNRVRVIQLIDEFISMRRLHHPNIINYMDAFRYEDKLWVVTEGISDMMTLQKVVATNAGLSMAKREAFTATILPHISQALDYLHRHGISHRGIDMENILFSKMGHVRLKLCAMIPDPHISQSSRSSPPEVRAGQPYDFKSDIWNLGALIIGT
ncbi:kinase-like domain-containing protein [Armillaria luteobubalina]|uniref:Kinase-like domain-containing protein n=1 Tax=Armillaria luteobubalina TaxID=153913 RepID=A0AA39TT01_9AGAR|nr:kinase-like domain-containing protein [Armillaria luteobubalina]